MFFCFVLFYFLGAAGILENEGIPEDPAARIGREVQDEKSLGGLREKFDALRRFSSATWRVGKLILRTSCRAQGEVNEKAPRIQEESHFVLFFFLAHGLNLLSPP